MRLFPAICRLLPAAGLLLLCGCEEPRKMERPKPPTPAMRQAQLEYCRSNLRQLGIACRQYAMDHQGYLPAGDDENPLQPLLDQSYCSEYVHRCPLSHGHPGRVDYVYLGSGGRLIPEDADLPLAFDRPGNHDGTLMLLFQDGSVREIKTEEYYEVPDIVKILKLNGEKKRQILSRMQLYIYDETLF